MSYQRTVMSAALRYSGPMFFLQEGIKMLLWSRLIECEIQSLGFLKPKQFADLDGQLPLRLDTVLTRQLAS